MQDKINQKIGIMINLIDSLTERQADTRTVLCFLMLSKFVKQFTHVRVKLSFTVVLL